jgi:hypothetical protein
MYQCQDCTHKAKTFPGGECTGCGSKNVRRIKTEEKKQPVARKGLRISLSWVLWGYLALGIYRKYFMGEG